MIYNFQQYIMELVKRQRIDVLPLSKDALRCILNDETHLGLYNREPGKKTTKHNWRDSNLLPHYPQIKYQ
jgi:hypothetical protein